MLKAELLHVITDAIAHHPRSLQKRIGPSEVGIPCARRIGYKLLDIDEVNDAYDVPWLPTVGTGVHSWLEEAFTRNNTGQTTRDAGHTRWLVELRVDVGEINGQAITGNCDLYDRVTATVVDWKCVGDTPLRNYKANGPGEQYRAQAHLYGRGLARRGLPVDTVAIAFLPRNAELRNAHIWHERYDEQVAVATLQRASGIGLAVTALGNPALAQLPTEDANCTRCSWYKPGSEDLTQGCPGHKGRQTRSDPITGLIA